MKNFLLKLKESALSVAPIALTVLVLGFATGSFTGKLILQFFIGALMLTVGMALFNTGADVAMVESGNLIGAEITKSKKIGLILLVCFILGLIISVAEPDLMVLAGQLSAVVSSYALILSVGTGVGIFMVIAMLRILFKIPLRILLIGLYALVFLLAVFVPKEFLPMAFDSGGVTTGPMAVPFIMAFGTGIAATKGGSEMDDSFGIVALCSVGPIIAVMLLGFFADADALSSVSFVSPVAVDGYISPFLFGIPHSMQEVAIALLPIVIFIAAFNFIKLKLSLRTLAKMGVGFVNVYIGLVIFLTGVNTGFAPVGRLLGVGIISGGYAWTLVPVAVLLGFFTVLAEPAIHVLTGQIEEISGGTINKKKIIVSLMLGVAAALGLAMMRVMTGISIWWLIAPGYAIALILSFFSPKIFTAIAFDSGGVASGPMTATFILPFAIGASLAKGGNILTDAFGVVALVAMTPLIAIQLLGIMSANKSRKQVYKAPDGISEGIIDFDQKTPETPVKDGLAEEIIDFDSPTMSKKSNNSFTKRVTNKKPYTKKAKLKQEGKK